MRLALALRVGVEGGSRWRGMSMRHLNYVLHLNRSSHRLKEMLVEIKTIQNRKEYKAALEEIELLWSAPAKSADADRLDVLTLLVEHYEKTNFTIGDPDPIEFLEHVMESLESPRVSWRPVGLS